MSKKEIKIKSLEINYLYPFVLPFNEVLKKWGKISKHPQKDEKNHNIEFFTPYLEINEEYLHRKPFNKDSYEVDINLPNRFVLPSRNEKLATHHSFLNTEIYLKKNGNGCVILKLKVLPQKPLDVKSALDFLLLVELGARLKFLSKSLNFEFPKEWKNGNDFAFMDIFKINLFYIVDRYFKSCRKETESLLRDRDFHPYLITSAELKSASPYDFLYNSNDKMKFYLEFACLLIRTYAASGEKADQIDENYIGLSRIIQNKEILNLHPFPHLFVNIHTRSCLVLHGIYTDHDQYLKKCGDEFIGALIDTVRDFRILWSSYVYHIRKIESLLEKYILEYYPKFADDELKGIEDKQLENVLKEIIDLRTGVSLALHEPSIYAHVAGAFSHIFQEYTKIFRIEQLDDSLRFKLKSLDRMYDDLRELYRLKLRKVRK